MTYEMTLLERERQGIEKGFDQGIAQGIAQGIEKVALNMFGMKMSFEEIHKATNLPISRIKELAAQNNVKEDD